MDAIKTGDVVTVGPAYQMADHPPFIGRGSFVADQWTGKTYRVVAVAGRDAELAPADILDADESDAVVSINLRRLTRKA